MHPSLASCEVFCQKKFTPYLVNYGGEKTISSIESTDKKLINAELALLFNETCKNKYVYI